MSYVSLATFLQLCSIMGEMGADHVDVLIVGAGLSGIGAACHLETELPGKSYAILEARERLGGTWDLFRYPGIRSDSDMYTLGYRSSRGRAKSIADGPSILSYVQETAREYGVEEHIRFNHRVVRSEWSSEDASWTVFAERTDTRRDRRADLPTSCSCAAATTATTRATRPSSRDRAVRRRDRPPAALARGSRLRRQARRRDRQRRDRGDAGARRWRSGRARDDAPALADVHRRAARRGPASRTSRASTCREDRVRDRALEERAADPRQLTSSAAAARR